MSRASAALSQHKNSGGIAKAPTGLAGLDQVTGGGIPRGRSTIICGGAGSGKTMMAMQILLNGILQYGEPGVCVTFEETAREMAENLESLGYDLPALTAQKKLLTDYVHVDRTHIEETGRYDLAGLFIRLDHAIRQIKAKRVVIDTIEVLFAGLKNRGVIRAELTRIFRWLKERGVTAIVTAESGQGRLTRHGLEEYVADCVIVLDHRVQDQISTRRLRILKYRGTPHGTNEYPFLMDKHGISVMPITSLGLAHQASTERVSTGIKDLDEMMGGRGFYRGSSIMISGTAGTGKSSFAARFVASACKRGERALYFAFEESPSQIVRNMRSIGLDLAPYLKNDRLRIHAARPTSTGLESHLAIMYHEIQSYRPRVVAIDPITNLISAGERSAVKTMLTRLIDFLKLQEITALFTNLSVAGEGEQEPTQTEISSLMDTWLLLKDVPEGTHRRRLLYVLKSRGMSHSNQAREFALSDKGIEVKSLTVARPITAVTAADGAA